VLVEHIDEDAGVRRGLVAADGRARPSLRSASNTRRPEATRSAANAVPSPMRTRDAARLTGAVNHATATRLPRAATAGPLTGRPRFATRRRVRAAASTSRARRDARSKCCGLSVSVRSR
jgi:hypothetical protein